MVFPIIVEGDVAPCFSIRTYRQLYHKEEAATRCEDEDHECLHVYVINNVCMNITSLPHAHTNAVFRD